MHPSESSELSIRRVDMAHIPRADWERLLGLTPAATPFARWTFHRAWWDAYSTAAEDGYLLAEDPEGQVRAIIPLMRRQDDADVVFFGASYHADYATILADPADLPAVARLLVKSLEPAAHAEAGRPAWDAVDLRRLRSVDPVLPALDLAFRSADAAANWRVTRELEDVCPVVNVPDGDWDTYLATLAKKDRHEIRRKLRRAAVVGELAIEVARPEPAAIEAFISLHNARWGERGLFPNTPDGQRTTQFLHRLADLALREPDGGQLHVAFVRCGERLVFAALAFDDGETCFLYNAGMDPQAAEASPGVTGTALYMRNRMEAGRRRFDFLRGNEPYKYEWGARDEPIERIHVLREGWA